MKLPKDHIALMGEGIPVVLLHSAMSSKLQWYRLMRVLKDRYLTIALDLLGYGEAPFPDKIRGFSLGDEAAWVHSCLDGIVAADEPFHLVGHSYGGALALYMAHQLKGRVRSLSLFEPVAFHLLPADDEGLALARQVAEMVVDKINQGKNAEAAGYFIDYYSGQGTFATMPAAFQKILAGSVRKVPLDCHALSHEPLSVQDYSQIKAPVCLLAGKKSPLASRSVAQFLVEQLADCRLEWVDSGHSAPIDQPEQVNPIIERFIRAHS